MTNNLIDHVPFWWRMGMPDEVVYYRTTGADWRYIFHEFSRIDRRSTLSAAALRELAEDLVGVDP